MAAATSEDTVAEERAPQSAKQKPCRICSDFKTWAKSNSQRASDKQGRRPTKSESSAVADPLECPADREELGRATWTFLHTTAAYYPDMPSSSQQQEMRKLITATSKLYPCDDCAYHMRKWIRNNPPQTAGREELCHWMCAMHNEVNERLEKPLFDCSRVDERWLHGWKDGSCD